MLCQRSTTELLRLGREKVKHTLLLIVNDDVTLFGTAYKIFGTALILERQRQRTIHTLYVGTSKLVLSYTSRIIIRRKLPIISKKKKDAFSVHFDYGGASSQILSKPNGVRLNITIIFLRQGQYTISAGRNTPVAYNIKCLFVAVSADIYSIFRFNYIIYSKTSYIYHSV